MWGSHTELYLILRVILASLLGAFIGWEREHHVRGAGIRTYSAIALGSCVFAIISLSTVGQGDPARVSAQVVSGIGFLGAGVIFKQGSNVAGLTSAATIWATAAVGLSVAYGMYVIAILTTFIIFLLLFLPRLSWWTHISGKGRYDD